MKPSKRKGLVFFAICIIGNRLYTRLGPNTTEQVCVSELHQIWHATIWVSTLQAVFQTNVPSLKLSNQTDTCSYVMTQLVNFNSPQEIFLSFAADDQLYLQCTYFSEIRLVTCGYPPSGQSFAFDIPSRIPAAQDDTARSRNQ